MDIKAEITATKYDDYEVIIRTADWQNLMIASCRLVDCTTYFYVEGVHVYDKFRGKGYANKLMDIVTGISRVHSKPLLLTVFKKNTIAYNLYKKYGFTVVDESREHVYEMKFTP